MSLAEAIARHDRQPLKGPRCGVYLILAALDTGDADALRVAFADTTITNKTITLAVNEFGHPIQRETIGRHRRGECSCERLAAQT